MGTEYFVKKIKEYAIELGFSDDEKNEAITMFRECMEDYRFMGHNRYGVVGGILYYLSIKYRHPLRPVDLTKVLRISAPTIRKNFHLLIKKY